MLIKIILLVLALAACGPKNPDCPSCPIQQPIPPAEPPPPIEEIDKTITCNYVWDIADGRHFKIYYTVIAKKNKETFASLKADYHAYDGVVEGSSASQLYPAGVKNSGEVATFVWQASLTDMKAQIKSNPFNEVREASCI